MKLTAVKILVGLIFAIGSAFFYFSQALREPNMTPMVLSDKTQATSAQSFEKGHALKPSATNQWYSSLYASFPSKPLYALPVSYTIGPDGIGFSYPKVRKTANTIFALHDDDFTIKFTNKFTKPTITHIGDWSVSLNLKAGAGQSASFTAAHGVPFTTIDMEGKSVQLQIPAGFTIFNKGNKDTGKATSLSTDHFRLVTKNSEYIIAFPNAKNITAKGNTLTIAEPKQIFVGLLDKKENYEQFKKIAGTHILGTKATPEVGGTLTTTYQVTTDSTEPLIALYPHHNEALDDQLPVLGTYDTLRGPLKLVKTNSFTTSIKATTPPDGYEKLKTIPDDLKKQTQADIADFLKKPVPTSKDYYLGKWFGKASDLILLADTLGLKSDRDTLQKFVEPLFLDSLQYFSYDAKKTALIAKKPEFGNEVVNDHHFHYGYFIRTASVLSKYNPTMRNKANPMIEQMVQDIATTDMSSEKYPYLRNFDIYEGHSWADGYANFPDGNNQESTSEAINAWYGVYLWAKQVNNPELERYALYLYNTEIQSTYHYWFDKNNIYAPPYQHEMASIVWSGKVDFATWFSNETNMKYGIQLLPITPASTYLGDLPDFAKYDAEIQKLNGGPQKQWGDLILTWKSFYQPQEALKVKDTVKTFEDGSAKSLFLYWLYKNANSY